jgi:type I restriction enzyme S subunit
VVIPADWKEVRLGDLGVCLRGVSYKGDSDLSDGDTPKTVRLLRSNNVQNSLIQFNDVQYVNHDCVSDEQILRRDDIVICMANGSKVLVGKTGLYKDSQDARYTFGAFMGCFRSLSDQAHAIFVRYLFLTKQYQDYISNLLAGSSINNLTPKSIESLLFKVPPLKEQEAIAEALSDADAAIESLDALITKKRDVKQATMQQLLTGRTRLPGFNADWKEVRLGDLGVCLRGVSYKGDSDLSDGDTPKTVRLLRSNNVQNSLIQFNDVQYVNHDCVSDEQILRRDDIVICMANGSKVLVGKTGLYKDSQDARYTFGAFMGCFRSLSDQAHAIFVRYLFLTKQYQDYISNLLAGSSINNLTPKSIESLLFKVPPLKEQEAIAEALSEIDDELEELTKQVTKLRMVKEGMMQDLLTGKVRLA